MKRRVLFLVTFIRVMVVLAIGLVMGGRRLMAANTEVKTAQFAQLAQIIRTQGPGELTASLHDLQPEDDDVLLWSTRGDSLLHVAVESCRVENLWVFLDFMVAKKEILLRLFDMQNSRGMKPAVIADRGGEEYTAIAWVLCFFVIKYELFQNETFKRYWLTIEDEQGWICPAPHSAARYLLNLVDTSPRAFLEKSASYVLGDSRIPDCVKAEFVAMTQVVTE